MIDSSLGSLPTLIVPDDPVNGAIEKPKTPPPVEIDESKMFPPALLATDNPRTASTTSSSPAAPAQQQGMSSSRDDKTAADAISIAIGEGDGQTIDIGTSSSSAVVAPAVLEPSVPSSPAAASTASVPPSVLSSKDYKTMARRAAALAKLDRLAAGSKSVFDADMHDIGALGIGMQLYFMLTKYLSVTFLLMGMVALPTIVVNYFGNGVTDKLVDPLQLAYASLGNQGVNDEISSDPKLCLPKGEIDCTWTTVDTPFTSNPETVSWLITIADCIYSFTFLCFYLVYRYRAKKAIELHMTENLTPGKYAVYVRGLPADATEQEILDHFNTLYDLHKDDEYFPLWLSCCWGKRRKVNKALVAATKQQQAANRNVVTNLDHLAGTNSTTKRREIYLNTWIAEVSIGHPTGGLLRTFLSMEALTRSIAETQELIQILEQEKAAAAAGAVIHTGKPLRGKEVAKKVTFKPADEKLLVNAKQKLDLLNAAMAKKTSKIKAFKQAGAGTSSSPKKSAEKPEVAATQIKSKAAGAKQFAKAAREAAGNTEQAFNWEACQCAFVVFNNLESKRRCLRDYRKSTWWLPHKYQPKLLRFREGKHALIVEPAPEPSNILWENLETTDRGRFYRRSFTNFVTFLLLLFSCAIISGAQSAQQTFKAKMPPAGLCEWSLPQVFYGSSAFDETTSKLKWELQWNPNASCPSSGVDSETQYHIAYSNGIVNDFTFNNTVVVQPGATAPTRCTDACISETSSKTCNTLPCFDQDLVDDGEVCETYLESHILYCLCTDALTTSIAEFGFFDGPKKLWETYLPCRGFIKDYLTKNAFIVVAAGIVVLVNLLLKAILRAFANFERHSSESAKASAIAIKMFSAQFLNTAIIVLVVNSALGLDTVPLAKELFNGKYKDFEREWYPTVGMGITMTMLINAFVPQLILFAQMFLVAPILRCMKRRKIRTQDQMNKLYAGPQFDISVRYPMILNSVFVTMVFCGGSPILLFIAAVASAGTFWFDKLSIIHLYSIKTTYDEELGETALSILPWTLVLHLGFSTWMYGNTKLMKSTTLDLTSVLEFFGYSATSASSDPNALYEEFLSKASKIDILGENGFMVKIVHSNVMTMFVFFLVVLVGIFLSTLWLQVLLPILKRTLFLILHAIWKRVKPKLSIVVQKMTRRKKEKRSKQQRSAKVAVENAPPAAGATVAVAAGSVDAVPQTPESAMESPTPAGFETEAVVAADASQPLTSTVQSSLDQPPAIPSMTTTVPTGVGGTTQLLTTKSSSTTAALSMVPSLVSPRSSPAATTSPIVVVPEFTDYFRKSVSKKYRPDTRLGFTKNADGELIRKWQDETIVNGIHRLPGEQMRTWEAMQAPVKIYAIEANSKYKLAVAELIAAAKRVRTASAALSKIEIHPEEQREGDKAETSIALAISDSILATEPVATSDRGGKPGKDEGPRSDHLALESVSEGLNISTSNDPPHADRLRPTEADNAEKTTVDSTTLVS